MTELEKQFIEDVGEDYLSTLGKDEYDKGFAEWMERKCPSCATCEFNSINVFFACHDCVNYYNFNRIK